MKFLITTNPRHGFTLIELLVVISIIALLIGILLPVLGSARTSAMAVKCLSHQRQVGVGLFAYAIDFDGAIPRGDENIPLAAPTPASVTNFANTAHNFIWAGAFYASHGILIEGYVPAPELMDCPDGPSPKLTPGSLELVGVPGEVVAVAYTYRNLDETTNDKIEDLGLNQAGGRASMMMWDVAMDVPAVNAFGPGFPEQVNINHKSTVTNSLYSDGHAESIPYEPEYILFRPSDYSTIPSMLDRTDEILIRFDHANTGGDLDDPPALPGGT